MTTKTASSTIDLQQHGQRDRGDQGKLNGLIVEIWHGDDLAQRLCGVCVKPMKYAPSRAEERHSARSRRGSTLQPLSRPAPEGMVKRHEAGHGPKSETAGSQYSCVSGSPVDDLYASTASIDGRANPAGLVGDEILAPLHKLFPLSAPAIDGLAAAIDVLAHLFLALVDKGG